MPTFNDVFLSKFDNAVRQLGPVNTLIDKVVSRIAPTVEAKACAGYGCFVVSCSPRSCSCAGCEVPFVTWAVASEPWLCGTGPYYHCSGCGLWGAGC